MTTTSGAWRSAALSRARLTPVSNYSLCRLDGSRTVCKIARLYGWHGLKRIEIEESRAGDIVMVAGIEDIEIGDTIADLENPRPLAGYPDRRADGRDDLPGQ